LPSAFGWGATFDGHPAILWNPPVPFNYTGNSDGITLTITGYTGSDSAATIPSAIDFEPVTSVGFGAFSGISFLTSVTIPNSVISIGQDAFSGTSLTNVTIPDGVISIGSGAFSYCQTLRSVSIPNSVTDLGSGTFENTGLASVIIPDSVTNIGPVTFEDCTSLTNVIIGNGVTRIQADAFYYCTNLTSITIPNSVTVIEGDSPAAGDTGPFGDCLNLTNVTIGNNVAYIGSEAFGHCARLANFYFLGNAPSLSFTHPGPFYGDTATVYYLPGTTGWDTFNANSGLAPAVLWNPQATTFSITGGNFGFNITGPSNTVIVVEACTDLANPVWLPVSTNFLDASGASSFSDLQSGNYPARFYRFRSP